MVTSHSRHHPVVIFGEGFTRLSASPELKEALEQVNLINKPRLFPILLRQASPGSLLFVNVDSLLEQVWIERTDAQWDSAWTFGIGLQSPSAEAIA